MLLPRTRSIRFLAVARAGCLFVIVLGMNAICFAEPKRIDRLQEVASQAAGQYELTIQETPPRRAVLIPEPAIRFVMERCEGAFIYLWTVENQPVAVAQIYHRRFPNREKPLWLHQFRSLVDTPLELKRDARVFWRPAAGDIKWREFQGVPPPSSMLVSRRSQRKQLARKFHATEQLGGDDRTRLYQLELKPRELFTYQVNKGSKLVDGAIFWFARDDGNDPELLLIIEAFGKEKPDKWRYALVDFTSYRVDVKLNQELIETFPDTINQTRFDQPHHIWSHVAIE